jgi:hypothetical protein
MTVARDRILKQKDYDDFLELNPFFIIGVSDSSCRTCCESEKLLNELDILSNNGTLTYS